MRISLVFFSFSVFCRFCSRIYFVFFFFSSRRRHTRCLSDWSSDVCSSDLGTLALKVIAALAGRPDAASAAITFSASVPLLNWTGETLTASLTCSGHFAASRSEERRVGEGVGVTCAADQ